MHASCCLSSGWYDFEPWYFIAKKLRFNFPYSFLIFIVFHGFNIIEGHFLFRKSLDSFLPQSAIRRQWLSKKLNRNTLEQHLIDNFQLASERTDEPKKFFRMFLEFCWTLPFYGFVST